MDQNTKNKVKGYFDKIRESHIPKGSKIPHSPSWTGDKAKGEQVGDTEYVPRKNVTPDMFQRKYEVDGRKRRLTPKQILQAKYMLSGFSRRQSRLRAGYTVQTSGKIGLSQQRTLVSFFEGINNKFIAKGITEDYIANKMKEWLEAKRIVPTRSGEVIPVPDYKTQQGAFDRWKGMVTDKTTPTIAKKRQMTLTEYVTGDEDPQPEGIVDIIEAD